MAAIRDKKINRFTDNSLTEAAKLVDAILKGRHEFAEVAIKHLSHYLPTGTPIRGVIAPAVFLPNYAFSMNDTVVVSLDDPLWANNTPRLSNLLVHELFHLGFIQHQKGTSPAQAADGDALLGAYLWQLQNEGLATYVASRAKSPKLLFGDNILLDNATEITKRFTMFRDLVADCKKAKASNLVALSKRLWQEANIDRVTFVVGASTASRIEHKLGTAELVKTIERGPETFSKPIAELL